ncbi:hypothetical protein XTPLMG728_1038 [Xanthomonas translucens pv. poae]|uniref:Secreted protein n=1 Tax=Xanthomonas graminis pv. poae TaxID=227946 RepID=A0A0K2ZR74_9XANT|nr:hypothetical protein [Xanthomonas translucens]UKE60961.1 hypothetical protein KM539_14290 [Xanthomonas translucens pv. poae]CTP85885.1 hypothetical protein XTPLMG728_1038 [Xanthomonas translucens pv. poae]
MEASTKLLFGACFIALLHVPTAIAAAAATSAWETDEALMTPGEDQAHAAWRETMAHQPTPTTGCFHASYPGTAWQADACTRLPKHRHVHAIARNTTMDTTAPVGNGNDYALRSQTLISKTIGSFPQVSGVTSERSIGVPPFGSGGIIGPNEYSLQLNTNDVDSTSACAGRSGCTVWQQFIYATGYNAPKHPAVFMEYTLSGYGTDCPKDWISDENSCYRDSEALSVPDVPITRLADLKLIGSATAKGEDVVTFIDGSTAYSVSASASDDVLKIATVWKESEFNVVGNEEGARAEFNRGSSITVHVAATNGDTAAPICAAHAGTTGETNNLYLGSCSVAGGSTPSITFTEAN